MLFLFFPLFFSGGGGGLIPPDKPSSCFSNSILNEPIDKHICWTYSHHFPIFCPWTWDFPWISDLFSHGFSPFSWGGGDLPQGDPQDMPGLAVGDAVLISQTRRETMIICQPQQRNTAGRMFGGYLMRPWRPWGVASGKHIEHIRTS